MKMKKIILLGAVLGLSLIGMLGQTASAEAASTQSMYRVYNPNSGEHFYTASVGEKTNLIGLGWKDEGIGWTAPITGDPVYRMYNKNAGDHHYTTNADEKNNLMSLGWKYEGIGWYSATNKGVPLFRAYNPNAKAGSHNYTTNGAEQTNLLRVGWRDEGIAWYGVKETSSQSPTTPTEPQKPTTPTEPQKPVEPTPTIDAKKVADEIFELTNKERIQKGENPLERVSILDEGAMLRAKEYSEKHSHTRPNGQTSGTALDDLGYRDYRLTLRVMGENCTGNVWGSPEEVAQKCFTNWVNSPGHYANMLGGYYKLMGVGVYVSPYGRVWAVQWFADPR